MLQFCKWRNVKVSCFIPSKEYSAAIKKDACKDILIAGENAHVVSLQKADWRMSRVLWLLWC